MKKAISYLLALLLVFFAVPLQAQINGRKWFAELSAGGGRSHGSFEMNEFYDPTVSIAFDFGYMLRPNIAIVPFCASYHEFRFNKENYIDHYWNNIDKDFGVLVAESGGYSSILANNHQSGVTNFEAVSQLHSVSFTPGIMIISPDFAGLRGFCQVGAGIYHAQTTIDILYGYVNYWGSEGNFSIRSEAKYTNLAMLVSGGVEYHFSRMAGLVFKLRYNYVNNENNKALAKIRPPSPLSNYYITGRGLMRYPIKDDKNTGILQAMGGFRFYY